MDNTLSLPLDTSAPRPSGVNLLARAKCFVGGGVTPAAFRFSCHSLQMNTTCRTNDWNRPKLALVISAREITPTSVRISEKRFVNGQRDEGREDVCEGGDCPVSSARGFGSPDGHSHHTTSNVASCVGGDPDGCVSPDDHRIPEADHHRNQRGGNVEVGWVNARPNHYPKQERLVRKQLEGRHSSVLGHSRRRTRSRKRFRATTR